MYIFIRSKKNSSLILLGVFTLGVTQSYVVEALTETSANLAKESDNESKQQDIDVKQGTDVKSVDSEDESFLYINDDKNTKSISRVPKNYIVGGTAGVVGLLVTAAIVVKKALDSKRDIGSKQDDSNENNEDSERNKEVEKDLDDQKEKADNQDSKDEVKSQDSKSISSLPFIVLGVGAIVVVGLIVYFVCKGKRKDMYQQTIINTSTNKEESNNKNESKLKKLDEEKVKEIYDRLKNIGENLDNVWTLEKLKRIFKNSSNSILKTLLKEGDEELKNIWFCDKNAKYEKNMKILFSKNYEKIFGNFFEKISAKDKKATFFALIDAETIYDYDLGALLDFILLEYNKINFTPEIVRLLLNKCGFASYLLKNVNTRREFAVAILTGNYKGNQSSFKVNLGEPIGCSFNFDSSPEENVRSLLCEFSKRGDNKFLLLDGVFSAYENWNPDQQPQAHLSENKV